MSRTIKLLCIVGIIAFLYSCRKEELHKKTNIEQANNSIYQNRGGSSYQQVVSYLKDYQDTISEYQASKIDTLLANLSDYDLTVIPLDENVNLIVCGLASYKNPSVSQYTNTFYKACFTSENGQIIFGQYFTFYTNLPKTLIDEDLPKIFNYESSSFTGVIATNSLNDGFFQEQVYSDGKIIETYALSPLNREGLREGGECVTLWLVHTTLYSDGSIDRDWELLGTFCNGCVPNGTRVSSFGSDCDNVIGGGGGSPGDADSEGNFTYYVALGDNSSCGVTMQHRWRGVKVWGPFGYSYACQADPATCSETYLNCTYLGKAVTRRAWPSSNHPDILRIADRRFRITWNYVLFYSYTFSDGSGVVTNYTTVKSSKLVSV